MIRPRARATTLVVESEDVLRGLILEVIAEAGFNTVAARTIDEAHALLDSGGIDIVAIVSDDGEAVAGLARRAPTIAITQWANRWSAAELGVMCLVPLPFSIEELEEALQQCLAAHPEVADDVRDRL